MKTMIVAALAYFVFSSPLLASILPPNNLHLEDDLHSRDSNLTEKDFLSSIQRVVEIYQPIIESHGANLEVQADWKDRTVNAFADQKGSTWIVSFFGGFARRQEVTLDAFTLVVCHEMGHHLAGFPFYKYKDMPWASAEGQSDYWASQECLRKVWIQDLDVNKSYISVVDPLAKKSCDQSWAAAEDQHLCYRTAMAGLSVSKLFARLNWHLFLPSFGKEANYSFKVTQVTHPRPQCRLNTYLAGALCTADADDFTIPKTELEQKHHSCFPNTSPVAASRPSCWFTQEQP